MWRNYKAHAEGVASECVNGIWTDEPYTPTGNRGGGGSTAIQVKMNRSGRLGWLKPARPSADSGIHVANEKIAADLGHLLNLPVAPVILMRPPAGGGLPPIAALSFEMLDQPRGWADVEKLLAPEELTVVKGTMTAMRIFHAWICDSDHNGKSANVLMEKHDDGRASICYFDHSNSLTRGGWAMPGSGPEHNYGRWDGDFTNPDRAAADAILRQIGGIASSEIRRIIQRIPDECLPPPRREEHINGLDARRGVLRGILRL